MVRIHDWMAWSPSAAAENAAVWWGSQDRCLAWLDNQLHDAGLRMSWYDDEALFAVWGWLVAWAAEAHEVPVDMAPVWFDSKAAEVDPNRCGVATTVAADALSHSLEAHLRAQHPDLERMLGTRALSATESNWVSRAYGEHQPVLVLPLRQAASAVHYGYQDAQLLASHAHAFDGAKRDCPLIALREATALRYETALERAAGGVHAVPDEFNSSGHPNRP